MSSVKSIILAALAGMASGHMIMTNPVPYNHLHITQDPLVASQFPCKLGQDPYKLDGTWNTYALGSKQSLSFKGTAVHGGGSCQLSLSTDLNPTADSRWKVIHSVLGGCPARNTPGNLGDDASAPDPFTYDFTLPSDIPAGNYTFAWTWLNNVGNREFYMNCAPMTLTGTGGDKSNLDNLPDMFVANIDGLSECTVPAYKDVLFPQPGDSVETNNFTPWSTTAGCTPYIPGLGLTSQPYVTGSAVAAATTGGAATSAVTTAASSPAAQASTPASGGSTPGGVFVTLPSSGGASAAATSPVVTPEVATTQAVTSAAATSAVASSGGSTSSGSGTALTGACSPDGTWNCLDGSTYQRCASGTWSVAMPVAAGTKCQVGQSTTLNMVARDEEGRKARAFRA